MPVEIPGGPLASEDSVPVEIARGTGTAFAPNLWRVRNLFLFLASAVVALVVANLLTLVGYTLVQPLMGWKTPPQALHDNAFFLLTLQLIFHGLLFAYIYLLIVVNYRQPFWATLRWHAPRPQAVVNFFAGGVLLALVIQSLPPVLPDHESFPLQRLFSSPAAAYAIGAFAIFVAPFMEELIFRGFLFRFFEHRIGLRFAVAGTAILFAGLHVPEYWGAWNHVLLIFLVGVVFSLARGLTGSLAPSIILHLAYNTSLMVVLFVGTERFQAIGSLLAP